MVSPVRVRAPPLLFCKDLQVKHTDKEEPRSTIGALYTNYYTNALGKHHVEPIYGFSLHGVTAIAIGGTRYTYTNPL